MKKRLEGVILSNVSWLNLELEHPRPPDQLAGLPEALATSWRRSLAEGVGPEGPDDEPLLEQGRLDLHRDRVGLLLRTLDEALRPAVMGLAERDFSLLFADTEGVIVERRGGGAFEPVARALHLQPGSVWSEGTRGTNAIGTALVEKRPVAVHGAAHLARANHELVCYAAPVHDPWGDVMGVLDATSYKAMANPVVGVAVFAAARALEEALQLRMLVGGASLVERLLGRLKDGALLVSPRGQVTHANLEAFRAGLPLGTPWQRQGDVARVRVALDQVLPVGIDELDAAARGQIRIPGLEVESVAAANGRVAAYLVVIVPAVASRPCGDAQDDAFRALVGTDPALAVVRAHGCQVARSSLPVLITGETGTGKELVATGIHRASERRDRPFVDVNCGAIAPSLIHAELFGHGPHAFTDAGSVGRDGLLARAHGGTLFLDELGEMPLPLQALFLRFLETGTYHRVGESEPRRADVRLVAATRRDLDTLVATGSFRADLLYRIRGALLRLPPVRERSDRALLSRSLLVQLAGELRLDRVPFLSERALDRIDAHDWPGNVRELRMALHHALVVADGARTLEPWHLPLDRSHDRTPAPAESRPGMAGVQAAALQRALERHRGNVTAAARQLGVARSTVYRMAKRMGLVLGSERSE